MSEGEVRELLRLFSEVWARRDVPALLGLLTPDAVYAASVGPEPGTTFRGQVEIAAGLAVMFAHDEGAQATQGEPMVLGDAAVSTWTYTFSDGRPSQHGVDLWRFRDGRIALKDAYRKVTLRQEPTEP
jgi:ketosteroid isomerase-like protein